MNKMTLISARANRYPIQFLVPPKNESKLPQIPGTCFNFSESRESYRSGLNLAASGPQISVEVFTLLIARSYQYLVMDRGATESRTYG